MGAGACTSCAPAGVRVVRARWQGAEAQDAPAPAAPRPRPPARQPFLSPRLLQEQLCCVTGLERFAWAPVQTRSFLSHAARPLRQEGQMDERTAGQTHGWILRKMSRKRARMNHSSSQMLGG